MSQAMIVVYGFNQAPEISVVPNFTEVEYTQAVAAARDFTDCLRGRERVRSATLIRLFYNNLHKSLDPWPLGAKALDSAIRAMLSSDAKGRERYCKLLLRVIEDLADSFGVVRGVPDE